MWTSASAGAIAPVSGCHSSGALPRTRSAISPGTRRQVRSARDPRAPRETRRKSGRPANTSATSAACNDQIAPEEELSHLRTVSLPELTYRRASADFFLLFSTSGLEDVRYVRGDLELKGAAGALLKAHFNMLFPDHGPEKIVRRGILSCSENTKPFCSFVLLLPANTTN
jgi:hypothetical protein